MLIYICISRDQRRRLETFLAREERANDYHVEGYHAALFFQAILAAVDVIKGNICFFGLPQIGSPSSFLLQLFCSSSCIDWDLGTDHASLNRADDWKTATSIIIAGRREDREGSVLMQNLSDLTETVLSNQTTGNIIVPSFKDSPTKPLGRRPREGREGQDASQPANEQCNAPAPLRMTD